MLLLGRNSGFDYIGALLLIVFFFNATNVSSAPQMTRQRPFQGQNDCGADPSIYLSIYRGRGKRSRLRERYRERLWLLRKGGSLHSVHLFPSHLP